MTHPWILLQRKMAGEHRTVRMVAYSGRRRLIRTALIEPSYALDLQQSWEYLLGFVAVVCYAKHVETLTER